ncbi:LysR family transcriptional regulator [Paenibacillus sp. GSMTC-2017]|uniref:LysR family transcriptional regulator n=1 Tax=Paenibacillus sp. GSMTC-2017 TaxID=2794350 RepID=UPI0018D5AF94|nr:LysR family transcriptional regulator [Paenibacillus sp. GSMTC-2017]MBH5318976.1 LysR family transcriptional regulator [Paenibacillus sp. GSMTC-2017]
MDISQLEAFLSVSKIRNFTRAAEYLHISQSAVTARIQALEKSIGKSLFLRDNRNVSLTQAGIHFLPYAERMLILFEESKVTLAEGAESYLVMSGPGSVWHYYYFKHILTFRQTHPKVALKFLSYIDSSYMIRDLLLDGVVQVAIRYDEPDRPNVTKQLLFEDEIILVSSRANTHLHTKSDFLSGQYYHLDWGHSFTKWFEAIVGGSFLPTFELDHSTIMLTMILHGEGFGFLPRTIAQSFLDTQQLYELRCEVPFPITKAYGLYLTENRDHPNVQLGLKLLGVL